MADEHMEEEELDAEVEQDNTNNDSADATEPEPAAKHESFSMIDPPEPDLPLEDVEEDLRFEEHLQLEEAGPAAGSPSTAIQTSNLVYWNKAAVARDGFEIRVPQVKEPWDYVIYDEPEIDEVLEECSSEGNISYLVRFVDERVDEITIEDLLERDNGEEALKIYNLKEPNDADPALPTTRQRVRTRHARTSKKPLSSSIQSSDEELRSNRPAKRIHEQRRLGSSRTIQSERQPRWRKCQSRHSLHSISAGSSSEISGRKRRRSTRTRLTRDGARKQIDYAEQYVVVDDDSEDSDVYATLGKRKRWGRPLKPSPERVIGTRKSGRNVRSGNMQELGEDDIPTQVTSGNVTKFIGAKEQFKKLPLSDEFRLRHCQICDTCNDYSDSADRGHLIYCQGCTLSYHQKCLGPRNTRDHLVTKIADDDFILQCRRCISFPKTKDPKAPDQSKCFVCTQSSIAAHPFRERKNVKQEQKDREENEGQDPITEVAPEIINNLDNVLFRCLECTRACHFHHLPTRDIIAITNLSTKHIANDRLAKYSSVWHCKTCEEAPEVIDSLVAWRPTNVETYQPGTTGESVSEDDKEYLIKWKRFPYTEVTWMPGPWVWGVTQPVMRKAFNRRDRNDLPKMQTGDAVPEDFHRIDIVFDIKYTNVVKVHTVEVNQARVEEVEEALVKFKGLGYEDVVWIRPPKAEEGERWEDFKSAYNDWVMGSHIHPLSQSKLDQQLVKLRSQDFETSLKLDVQPESLTGAKLMHYQTDGINWLYYQWFRKQNAILADEMGLGKTIQIIGFLTTLTQRHNCFPFLVVVPNSTCPNWRREIKKWAPSMRVVTYYGSMESRKLAQKHELFPGGAKDLCCHVVVTSYDAAQDDEFRKVFRSVHWQGLVVDEGQRLKNDKNLLYGALNALRIPFKVLLTGTPLQNNPRELFNLIQFLDTSLKAKKLEEEYAELTKDNVSRLHEVLRPFFLRRTKAQVLTFLPPMAQIIVPVSLTSLQKKLYRSILAKNPELIRSIFGVGKKVKQQERASLNNILMQLRKCLCHPFVYSRAIEQIDSKPIVAHRNLVDASSKLKLLEIMLPKLQESGHRVLIFSQFLNMLDIIEDFMDSLGLYYQRLDGTMGSLQKQRCIDEFNAPDSQLFAFLLSTRAGGVGINLATADTVIILDPDFNPHQDIQALSRAHRIGQKKKVIVFQLTTRGTAEERIMQVGKKKMSLDHVLIEAMETEDDAGVDLESILRYGTDAIFKDDDAENDIRYDSASVDKLLDRSEMENTLPGKDNSAESQFSFAKVWANDKATLLEECLDDSFDQGADPGIWDEILKEREREAAEEVAATAEVLGRGRRKRQDIDYAKQVEEGLAAESPPVDKKASKSRRHSDGSESDTDYQAWGGDGSHDDDLTDAGNEEEAAMELESQVRTQPSLSTYAPPIRTSPGAAKSLFSRAEVPVLPHGAPIAYAQEQCLACTKFHQPGTCPLMLAGFERCGLCGLAHFGYQRTCPHLTSVTQLRLMNEAIKSSPEPQEIKDLAKKRVVQLIGSINQTRRQEQEAKARKEKPLHSSLFNSDPSFVYSSIGGPRNSYTPNGKPPNNHFPNGASPSRQNP